jgi:outer membrane protein OmpA-like peptidoglycan-associated protein
LAAAFQGGDLVRSNDTALLKAATVNAEIFKEQNAEYWYKGFKGYVSNGVSLGGSTTSGLGDNLYAFGLNGNDNLYKRVYTVFGKVTIKYFPDFLKEMLPYESVVNTTYVQRLAGKVDASQLAIAKPTYAPNATVQGTFAKKAVSIEFDTGRATLTSRGIKQLNEVIDNLAVSGLVVEVRGHTDSVGSAEANQQLSKARAEAVKRYIATNASSTFPENRLRTKGYGDSDPIADNKTADGRAQNRRVEIVQLTTSN